MDNKVLDEAVEVAQQAWRELIVKDAPSSREAMRAALLASLPVLLGPRVGWMVGDLFFDPDAEADARHEAQWSDSTVTAIYAPSLGEGDGR